TATPERHDQDSIMEIFKHEAHRLDLKTAVEIGELVPVRCVRVKTNIDFSGVRFNGIKYNVQDLDEKIHLPERNRLSWYDNELSLCKDLELRLLHTHNMGV
ncbi:MAG: hypothetical protein ABFD08_11890, partial [Syntrophomonas sp.]